MRRRDLPAMPKHRDRYTQAERRTIRLTCGTCGTEFEPKEHHKRGATLNFCGQPCRLHWTKRQFSAYFQH